MPLNKVVDKPVQIGEHLTRHTFKIYGDPSPAPAPGLIQFMQEFVNQPAFLRCGPVVVQKFAIYHNGECWVMSGEAEVAS